jgi:glycosyltransferase involved in cell wall biosynthesis
MTVETIFSIIIPTYNHGKYLRKAIDSVLNQTFPYWELVIVNNLSTDDTEEIVRSYTDQRIRLVTFSDSRIIGSVRNYGVNLSRAPVIALLDSDDSWYPEKLEKCFNKMKEGFDLICHAEVWVGPGSRRRTAIYGPDSNATFQRLLFEGNCLSTSACIFKREIFNAVNGFSAAEDFRTAEDYDFWLKIAATGARIGFVKDVLGEYLIHETNQSRGSLRNMDAELAVFNFHVNNLPPGTKAYPWSARRRTALIYYSGARMLQEAGLFIETWKYFLKAVVTFPFVSKFYLAMLLNIFHVRPR